MKRKKETSDLIFFIRITSDLIEGEKGWLVGLADRSGKVRQWQGRNWEGAEPTKANERGFHTSPPTKPFLYYFSSSLQLEIFLLHYLYNFFL